MSIHRFPLRVYPADTDHGGIVHHAQYWRYCEQARVDWFEKERGPIEEATQSQGLCFVVTRVHADYFKPARLYDKLEVETKAVQVRPTMMAFEQRVLDAETDICLFAATLDLVCVNSQMRPKPVPKG